MQDKYLVFDLGASNGRAIIGHLEQGKIAFEEIHRFDNHPVFVNGEYFWDILNILGEVKIGLKKAFQMYGACRSMAIDTWGCDFGIIDSQGRLMGNPVHYRDTCRREVAPRLHSVLSEQELFDLCGGPLSKIMGVYELYSMKERNTFEYEHGHRLMMIPDLLHYFLTGKIANEFCNATMTLLVNQNTRQWEPQIFETLGLRMDLVTPLIEPGTVLGNLSESVCRELEIEPIPVVIPPTHDTAAAVAGIPATGTNSWAFISLGTWGLAGMETSSPVLNQEIVPYEFGNEGGVEGTNLLLKNIVGMWVIQQCRKQWNMDQNRIIPWEEIVEEAKSEQDFTAFIDIENPIFAGVQPHMPDAIKDYCKSTNQPVPSTIGQIACVAFKSLAMEFKYSFFEVCRVTALAFDTLHIVGGGIQNKLLCQWTCDAVGKPVIAGPTETASIGNLLFQLKADGKIKDVNEGRQLSYHSCQTEQFMPQNPGWWETHLPQYTALKEGSAL